MRTRSGVGEPPQPPALSASPAQCSSAVSEGPAQHALTSRTSRRCGEDKGWCDATWNEYPDWLQADLGHEREVSHIVVATQALAAQFGIRDFDVQYRREGKWTTVAQVVSNRRAVSEFDLSPTTMDAVKVVVKAGSPGRGQLTGILALQAWGEAPSHPSGPAERAPARGLRDGPEDRRGG